jgi:hypothetical protein
LLALDIYRSLVSKLLGEQMSKEIYKDKYYTHFDVKKKHIDYERKVENIDWVGKHGFYPSYNVKLKIQYL